MYKRQVCDLSNNDGGLILKKEILVQHALDDHGKGVDLAIENINGKIKQGLIGVDVSDQNKIDKIMIDLDNSFNKSNLGANAILGTSLACLKAAAGVGYPLWSYIAREEANCSLPVPLMNILNGGAHANSEVDIQEFMIVPHGFTNFKDALRAGVEIYHILKTCLLYTSPSPRD